jgi:ankyrin repeat protein
LIAAGADVNVRNPVSKVNALFLAVKYTDLETVKMLIEANIDTSARNKYNHDAFYNAVTVLSVINVHLLLPHTGTRVYSYPHIPSF